MIKLLKRSVVLVFLISASLTVSAQRDVKVTDHFVVEGFIPEPVSFDLAAIRKLPEVDLGDLPVRNHKGEEKARIKGVKGVLLKTLLESVHITTLKPKELSELYLVLISSDRYKNVYSWNELFNTEIGNKIYVITELNKESMEQMDGAILVISLGDFNTGSRYLRGLQKIQVKRAE